MTRTASEVHGTGAVIMTLGIGTHGHIVLGDTAAGITTAAGMTHGTTAAIGDSTILGITADGTAITTTHITADGTEDGIRIIISDTSTHILDTIILQDRLMTRTSKAIDTRPDQTEYLPAAVLRSEEVQA